MPCGTVPQCCFAVVPSYDAILTTAFRDGAMNVHRIPPASIGVLSTGMVRIHQKTQILQVLLRYGITTN